MEKSQYRRLNGDDRDVIEDDLVRNMSFTDIALELKYAVSTISREVKSGGGRKKYCARCRDKLSKECSSGRKKNKRRIGLNEKLKKYVEDKIFLFWSPEQIEKRLKREYPEDMFMQTSKEAVYAYLYALPKGEWKKKLVRSLRQKHSYRYDRDRRKVRERQPSRATIEERPASVGRRKIPGHWEGDLIMGKRLQSAIGTLVERKTRFTLLVPVKNTGTKTVTKAFSESLMKLPEHLLRTLTYDQGKEMSGYHWLERALGIDIYITHAKSPWERPTNENTNGLIRQFFPKGTDFKKISKKDILKAQDLLNGRPRKVLDFRTPSEVFEEILR